MSIESFFIDDTFAIYHADELEEGKSIGTAHHKHLRLLNHVLQHSSFGPFPFSAKEKQTTEKYGLVVGKKKLQEIQSSTRSSLLSLTARFTADKLPEEEFRAQTVKTMKQAWRNTYLAGVRAGGVPGKSDGHGKVIVPIHAGIDDVWLASAMKHEMIYLNRFIQSIVQEDYKMPLPRRIEMYVRALESFWNSARVIALPDNVILSWAGPDDRKTCEGCKYLFENSPYTKFNLPTTPRAGMTACLTNCRDRILVRKASVDEATAVYRGAKYSRGGHISNLRKLKKTGHL